MLLLGLTGSIATGKTTVSTLLASPPYNLPVIDADLLARQVVEPGTPGYAAIVKHFSPTVPDLFLPPSSPSSPTTSSPPLNRPALGRRVFGSSATAVRERKVLNSIVHPAVRRAMYRALLSAYLRGHWAAVLDVPLLFESGWEPLCGAVLVVAVSDPAVQMRRLRERDPHLSEEDAENRVKSQVDVREKAKRCEARGSGAGVVVWNDGGREELRREVEKAMKELRRGSPRWWAWLLLACPPLGVVVAAWNYVRSWRMQRAWERRSREAKAKL